MDEAGIKILRCYAHLWEGTADINLLWGGRDSGKSYFIAQRLIKDCLDPDNYFRCILVKKTHESIKDAQWQLIKDIVEAQGMSHLFKFYRAPLEIHCTANSNKFIARGCDNPEKLKSIAEPSCVWIEEGNQLTQSDYLTISTTLRSTKGKIQEWISFNPESKGDYREHWIYRDFFEWDDTQLNYTRTKELEANGVKFPLTYTSTHTTYSDNPFCTPQQIARHEHLLEVNPHRYRVFTKGLWGNEDNDNPWAWALSELKHYTPDLAEINTTYPLLLSWDFNHDPCVVVVGQYLQHIPQYNIIGCYRASSSSQSAIKQLCDIIQREFRHHASTKMFVITGDASGTKRDPSRPSNINRYTDICTHLGINTAKVAIDKANPLHKASRDLINDVLHQLPKGAFTFYGGRGCEVLLTEIQSAYPDEAESLNKAKKDLGLHGLDAFRYMVHYWFAHRLTRDQWRQYQQKINAVCSRLKTTV